MSIVQNSLGHAPSPRSVRFGALDALPASAREALQGPPPVLGEVSGLAQSTDAVPPPMPVLGPGVLAFLQELAAHNDRAWMAANTARYRALVVEPLQALRVHLVACLAALLPGFSAPGRDSAIVRVHRDARFVGAGAPFRPRSGIRLQHRASVPGAPAPSVVIDLAPGESRVLVGISRAAAGSMACIREAIVAHPELFGRVVAQIEAEGGRWVGEPERRLSRVERALPLLAPHLARRSMAAQWDLSDGAVAGPELVPRICAGVTAALPLLRYQCLALGLDPSTGGIERRLDGAMASVLGPSPHRPPPLG